VSYLTFLLVFLAPPIALLALAQPRPMAGVGSGVAWKWILILCGIAFVYTTPWDNYLVYRGVWSYGAERVIGTIAYVPIEEYMFFILQPIMTGLWVSLLLGTSIGRNIGGYVVEHTKPVYTRAYVMLWVALTLIGALMLTLDSSLYMGLILVWCSPVLAGMAWLSTPLFWRYRRIWALGVAVPTAYLWIADRFAIGRGIWDISDTYSFDFEPFGLPIEEAVFFLVTNMLVVQGLLMLLPLRDKQ
jgi:lycopene beta-cyclase